MTFPTSKINPDRRDLLIVHQLKILGINIEVIDADKLNKHLVTTIDRPLNIIKGDD